MSLRVLTFDFGETLAQYEGAGLNWAAHYDAALSAVAERCELTASTTQIAAAKNILARYNTRHSPREHEITSDVVFHDILTNWQLDRSRLAGPTTDAFFSFFRRSLRVYPDTRPALQALRSRGYNLAVLTDVPYGMPKRFILDDLTRANILHLFDLVLSSTDVGLRKPHPAGLQRIAAHFRVACDQVAYVGNEPKDMAAASSAGALPVFLDRSGASDHSEFTTIRSLDELARVVDSGHICAKLLQSATRDGDD